jgi:carboxyl-terminal processing protease
MSRQRIVFTTAVAVVAFVSGGWFMQQGSRRDDNVYQRARLFDDVMSHIADYYVDPIDERQLYNMAISGMVNELHDPYSVFLSGRSLSGMNEITTGNYGGLGIQIEYRDNAIVVIAPLPDTPAERAGVITGDRIVEVDGQNTAQWNQELAVRNLRGPVGSQVTLKIQRPGVTDLITFQLTRAQIHARSVRTALMVDRGVGYVELNPFSDQSAPELRAAIDSLKRTGMKSLILDLRGNPGGLLDEGIAVSSLFLEPGQEVVSTRGRAEGATREFTDTDPQRYADLPIVVLVNGQSASASEIVAGALQDHDRALVIGTPTYGKGLVQTMFRLSNDAALKITTAKWYTPSGRSIQRQARNEQEQEDQVDSAAVRPDTAKPKPDQVFHTDHGRVVVGGGGIIPDVLIRPDSATEVAARMLNAALGKNTSKYFDALAAFALDQKAHHTVTSPTFELTPDMRAAFLALLARRGVTLDEQTLAAARHLLDEQVGYEVAQLSFGRTGGIRRLFDVDPVLEQAEQFASKARTPADLLTLAPSAAPAPAQRP